MKNMAKWFLMALVALVAPMSSFAQIEDPVEWTFRVEEVKGEEGLFDVVATATIEAVWHVYALNVSDDPNAIGPIPTTLKVGDLKVLKDSKGKTRDTLVVSKVFQTQGGPKEGVKYITHFDPNFDMDLNYFENKAVFKQRIKRLSDAAFEVHGVLEYMACNDTKCIFPDPVPFKLQVAAKGEETAPSVEASEGTSEMPMTDGVLTPVTWEVSSVEKSKNVYDVSIKATIADGWHLYSQYLASNEGPVATSFTFEKLEGVSFAPTVSEGKPEKIYDPNFMMDLEFFSHETTFNMVVETATPQVIKGLVNFMVCDDEKCLPPTDVHFKVDLATGKGEIYDPLSSTTSGDQKFQYAIPTINLKNPVSADCGEITAATTEGASLWELFILGFLGGLLALLTPCVFPMIPLTVTFFTKGSQSRAQGIRRAIVYGLFIFGIYVLLSLPFHFLDQIDENILNNISTNVPLNVAFFVIFVVFAISFFGYFEITLPSSFANKMDNASNVGGLIGTFFMALTLAIVSFSCTGPILGSLLAGSLAKDGGAIQLTAGMGGFGLALGIPFAIFAMFPGMLKSLPKSGGWLNSVKVVLGFAELALALKFLSQADLVDHWGILKYEVFMGLWVIIFILMALYIFGKIKFPHDSPLKKLSLFRIGFGVLVVSWVIYLASGFRVDEKYNTYVSLKALSGLAPPVGYSILYPKDCPHNLDCEHDYSLALERSKKEGKPLFIDFTGYACVNCRKMEEHVWIKPEILELLANDFIVVSLYVDDRKELPAELQETYSYEANGKKKTKEIKTYGDRWAAFEIATFNSNAQPLYAIVSPDEVLMNTPVGYTPDSEEYRSWLLCGLEAFEKSK